jgi:hypothetical protein
MPDLPQDTSSSAASAGLAELQASSNAIMAQDSIAQGSRSDAAASQVEGTRDVQFTPEPDSGIAAGAVGGAGSAGASGVAQLQPESEWESVQDVARSLGYQSNQNFADDRAFLLHLLNRDRATQEADYYSQLGRQLAPHYQGIQSYLGQRQAQAQAPAATPEWEAPEFDPRWMDLVQRDPGTGVYLARPGVNPLIADKVNSYDQWFSKYGHNPLAAVRPMLQAELPNIIGQQIRQELASFRREQTVNSIVERNSEWMYQHNNGRPVIGVGGQLVPTPQGLRYGQIVQQLEQGGMNNPVAVDQIARNMLLGEMAIASQQGSHPAPPLAQQNNALASSGAQRNVLQSLPPQQRATTPGATEPAQTGMSLHDMLHSAFESAGYTDADFSDPSRFMS